MTVAGGAPTTQNDPMRPVSRAALALAIACGAALGPATVAHAAPGSGSVTTAPEAEAWYQAAPVCTLPTGCPAGPPSPYAADTLHVGVVAGQEESRTFLQLDLSALPAGTKPAGGQLRLPVASGSRDGTRAPETAKLRACAVTEPVEDVDGEVGTGPKMDCDAGSVEAVFVPAADEAPAAFTVDLADLASTWITSAAPGALALLPAEEVAPAESWHVAFSDRTREGEDVAKITAAVSYVATAVDVSEAPPAAVSAPVDSGFSAPSSFDSGEVFAAPPSTFDAPNTLPQIETAPQRAMPAPAPQAALQQVLPVASFVDAGFRYPAVFLLPLLFAVAVGWLARALTRDLAADDFD